MHRVHPRRSACLLNTRSDEKNKVVYSYLPCSINTVTLNECVGFTRCCPGMWPGAGSDSVALEHAGGARPWPVPIIVIIGMKYK